MATLEADLCNRAGRVCSEARYSASTTTEPLSASPSLQPLAEVLQVACASVVGNMNQFRLTKLSFCRVFLYCLKLPARLALTAKTSC